MSKVGRGGFHPPTVKHQSFVSNFPGAIKRDTGVVAGGKQVIRLVTTKQKSNPYNLVGRNKNNPDQVPMTMGQRLAMKHFLVDPKQVWSLSSFKVSGQL